MKRNFRFEPHDILGLIFLLTLLFFRGSMMGDPGVGWHLKAGEWMFMQRSVPEVDPFLEPVNGYPTWVDDQWLSQILAWAFYSIGGMPILHLVSAVLCVAPFVYVLPRLLNVSPSALLVFLTLFLVSLQASIQWIFRPVIISFLLFAVVYRVASQRIATSELELGYWTLGLPLLFVFWANLHPAFPLGLFVVLLAVVCRARGTFMERFAFFELFLTCAVATLLNPYYYDLHLSIVSLMGNSFYTNLHQEWHPPELSQAAFYPFVLLALLLIVGGTITRPKSWRKFDIILLVVFFCLAFAKRRYLPFLGIVSALPLLMLFEAWRLRFINNSQLGIVASLLSRRVSYPRSYLLTSSCAAMVGIYVLIFGALPGRTEEFSDIPKNYPWEAAAILAADPRPGKIFHSPDYGGFLTWKLWPNKLAFIDDRNQILPEVRYREYFQIAGMEENWEKAFEAYQFRWVLIDAKMPLAEHLAQDPAWRVLGARREVDDDDTVLFERQLKDEQHTVAQMLNQ